MEIKDQASRLFLTRLLERDNTLIIGAVICIAIVIIFFGNSRITGVAVTLLVFLVCAYSLYSTLQEVKDANPVLLKE